MSEYPLRQPIWLRTKDPVYEEKLCHFLTYHYGDRMDVHRFEEYREGEHPSAQSLLLTDAPQETEEFERVVPLTMGERSGCINLYQSGHRIAEQILECGALAVAESLPAVLSTENRTVRPRREGELICVYSPIGGCGKTTFAMALAECLSYAQKGAVLYLNLEGASAWTLFFRNETSYNLSDFLYRLLLEPTKDSDIAEQLERVLSQQENGVFFIAPCTSFEDLNLLTPAETERLIRLLLQRFAWVVCDMNTAFHSVNRFFVQQSRRCFLLSTDEKEAAVKLRSFLQGLELYEELGESFREKTRFLRRGGKNERGDGAKESLPDCREVVYPRDHLWRLNRDSSFYQKVKEIAQEEIGRVGVRVEGLSVL